METKHVNMSLKLVLLAQAALWQHAVKTRHGWHCVEPVLQCCVILRAEIAQRCSPSAVDACSKALCRCCSRRATCYAAYFNVWTWPCMKSLEALMWRVANFWRCIEVNLMKPLLSSICFGSCAPHCTQRCGWLPVRNDSVCGVQLLGALARPHVQSHMRAHAARRVATVLCFLVNALPLIHSAVGVRIRAHVVAGA